jgi:hypothetical protein
MIKIKAVLWALALSLAACGVNENNSNSISNKDSTVVHSLADEKGEPKTDKQKILAQDWILFEFSAKDGKEFGYMQTRRVHFTASELSFSTPCNDCKMNISIDEKTGLMSSSSALVSKAMPCSEDKAALKPAKEPVDFFNFKQYKYKINGYYLVLEDERGEFWLRAAPNGNENQPTSLDNTAWQIIKQQKSGAKTPTYLSQPVHISFSAKHMSVSPDCNTCTLEADFDLKGSISWKNANNGFFCTQIGCHSYNKEVQTTDIENGMPYYFEENELVLKGERNTFYLRRVVFRE